VHTNLGITFGALQDPANAERHFREALALNPNFADGYYYYGRWLVDRGRAAEALELVESAWTLSKSSPYSASLLMRLQAARGDDERLHETAAVTLALAPGFDEARLFSIGESPIVVANRTSDAYFRKGFELTNEGRHLDAAIAYRCALRQDASNAAAANNLGWTLGQLGFVDEAIPVAESAVALDPSSELARNNLNWLESRIY